MGHNLIPICKGSQIKNLSIVLCCSYLKLLYLRPKSGPICIPACTYTMRMFIFISFYVHVSSCVAVLWVCKWAFASESRRASDRVGKRRRCRSGLLSVWTLGRHGNAWEGDILFGILMRWFFSFFYKPLFSTSATLLQSFKGHLRQRLSKLNPSPLTSPYDRLAFSGLRGRDLRSDENCTEGSLRENSINMCRRVYCLQTTAELRGLKQPFLSLKVTKS